jgi:GMP synthase-like glutamine amidotransferase
MKILLYDCHKNRIDESLKIADALKRDNPDIQVDIVEVRKLQFPNFLDYDAVVISGADGHSPKHMWVRLLQEELQKILATDKPILGVCFGSQLLAKVQGAEIYELAEPEVGWYEIELTELGKSDPLFAGFPEKFPVFQYHSRAARVEENALAKNASCVQAVRWRLNVYGIQFHPEDSPESGSKFLENDPHCKDFEKSIELKPENYIEWKIFSNFVEVVKWKK